MSDMAGKAASQRSSAAGAAEIQWNEWDERPTFAEATARQAWRYSDDGRGEQAGR